jgi:hypothetical protein
MADVGAVGGSGGVPATTGGSGDAGSASVGSLGTVASINSQDASTFKQSLGAASNADLMKLASTGGVDSSKRADALATLLDRLSTSGQAGTNAENAPDDSNDDDFTKKLKKLMKDMKAGKMDAEDQKTLAAIGSMDKAQDTTAGGVTAADIK